MPEINNLDLLIQQRPNLYPIGLIELYHLLKQPISLIDLPLTTNHLQALNLEHVIQDLRELVINDVILVHLVATGEEGGNASEDLLGGVDDDDVYFNGGLLLVHYVGEGVVDLLEEVDGGVERLETQESGEGVVAAELAHEAQTLLVQAHLLLLHAQIQRIQRVVHLVEEPFPFHSLADLQYRQIQNLEETIGHHVLLEVPVEGFMNSEFLVVHHDDVKDSEDPVEDLLVQYVVVVEGRHVAVVDQVLDEFALFKSGGHFVDLARGQRGEELL